MTATPTPVVNKIESFLYNGSNGADIVAEFPGMSFVSESGGTLHYLDPDSTPGTLDTGDRMVRVAGSGYGSKVDPTGWPAQWREIADLVTSFAPPAPALIKASGSTSVPASTAGQTDTYDVTLNASMPGTDYAFFPQLRGAPTIISGHAILSATIIDEDTVRVTVQSGVLSLAGSSVFVQAWAIG